MAAANERTRSSRTLISGLLRLRSAWITNAAVSARPPASGAHAFTAANPLRPVASESP